MSWIETIQEGIIIITGDGREWRPLWVLTGSSIDFNVSEFEFPEISGTLVKRKKPKGSRIPLEIVFQGDNYIEEYRSFKTSSEDERAWTLSHPFHGTITVQPLSLDFDTSQYNTCRVKGVVVETIIDDAPKTSIDPYDQMRVGIDAYDDTLVAAVDYVPDTADTIVLTSVNQKMYSRGVIKVASPVDAQDYFNLFKVANREILNASTGPLVAMRQLQAVLERPALFEIDVRTRIDLLTSQFEALQAIFTGTTKRSQKKIYENTGSVLISSQILAAINPLSGNYKTRAEILVVIEKVIDNYNSHIEFTDSLQDETGGNPDNYIPDHDTYQQLNQLLNFMISNLYSIVAGAKQERSFITDTDESVITLTHKLYGIDDKDENLDNFIATNDISLGELFLIKKGRRIIYYV
jgi:hypothetical protein